MVDELPERLELHHVPSDRLRSDWRALLGRVTEVRIAATLVARYEFGYRQYAVPVRARVEPHTGVVWLHASCDRTMAFYEALTDYLFDDTSNLPVAYGFRLAVEQPFDPGSGPEDVVSGRPAETKARQRGDDRDASVETPKTSHEIEDLIRIVPAPEPFEVSPIGPQHDPGPKNEPSGRPRNGSGRPRRSKPAATDSLRNTEEEQQQIRHLKEKHYAWHCQACLGAYDVTVAVPAYSYLTLDRHRREFVEAHHVDHLRNQGVLGARNLLVLCRFHHGALGDRLTRGLVVDAIRNGSRAKRRFPIDSDCTTFKPLVGTIAAVRTDSAPFEIRLFFTREHARAWLDVSSSDVEALAPRIVSPSTRRQQGAKPEAAAVHEPPNRTPRAGAAGDSRKSQ